MSLKSKGISWTDDSSLYCLQKYRCFFGAMKSNSLTSTLNPSTLSSSLNSSGIDRVLMWLAMFDSIIMQMVWKRWTMFGVKLTMLGGINGRIII